MASVAQAVESATTMVEAHRRAHEHKKAAARRHMEERAAEVAPQQEKEK